jgi:hypothetical protein
MREPWKHPKDRIEYETSEAEFLRSHSPVTRVQFCGLLLIGGTLLLGSLALFVVAMSGISDLRSDIFKPLLILIFLGSMAASVI